MLDDNPFEDDCTCLDSYASVRAVSRYGDGPFPLASPNPGTRGVRHAEPAAASVAVLDPDAGRPDQPNPEDGDRP